MRITLALVLCTVFAAVTSIATPRENEFGAGAVSSSLAGAGLASIGSPSATYLNPANLSRCKKSSAELGVRYIGSLFNVTQTSSPKNVNLLDNVLAAELSGCLVPLEGLGFGVWVSNNTLRPMTLGLRTLNDDIYFTRFGDSTGSHSIMAGVGYAFVPEISLGLSVFVSTRVAITQDVYAPLSAAPNPFKTDIGAKVSPRAGVVAGLSVHPFDFISAGLTFRTENYGRLDVDARTSARYLIELGPIHMNLTGMFDYSPQQFSFGVTGRPLEDLNLYADLDFVQWSLYNGPFLSVTPDSTSSISTGITLPPVEAFTCKDVFIPRFGVEYAFLKDWVARIGYSYHPAIVGLPALVTNLIDNDTHQIAVGGGYSTKGETVGFKIDVFAGLHYMPDATVTKSSTNYTFGGIALATGLTSAIEF